MFALVTFSTLLLAALAGATPAPSVKPAATGTASAATPTGSQLRTDQDPVYHLYLQNIDGQPILGSEDSSGYFTIGSAITLNQASGSALFLNVNTTGTSSFKSLTLDTEPASGQTWSLSGDTIEWSSGSGTQQNYVVCPISGSSNFNLFLQTGDDMPSTACTDWITLHLPCLC